MSDPPAITISLTHDSAIILAGVLADFFYGGTGRLEGRLSHVEYHPASELLTQLEECQAVSPLRLGPGFVKELEIAKRRIEARL
jgi:hypothetical protein